MPVSQLSVPLSVQDSASDVIVTLLARNSEWASQTTELIPKYWAGKRTWAIIKDTTHFFYYIVIALQLLVFLLSLL